MPLSPTNSGHPTAPTPAPTGAPTQPTFAPTSYPTSPTRKPFTRRPSLEPTGAPTFTPTPFPTHSPTDQSGLFTLLNVDPGGALSCIKNTQENVYPLVMTLALILLSVAIRCCLPDERAGHLKYYDHVNPDQLMLFNAQRRKDLAFRKKLYYGGQIKPTEPKVLLNPLRVGRRCAPHRVWSSVSIAPSHLHVTLQCLNGPQ